MDDVVGRWLGQYHVESLIGRGGMGDVYLARHERLDRPCALKVLRPQLSADPELRERFIREARAAARLEHPNIVTIYDAGEDDGVAYFAMQLVEGEPLTTLIRADAVTVPEALRIVRDVAAALDAAHESGMVHRDVKPANIIIAPDGTAMLTDFGIVHLRPEAQLTMTGQLLGTPAYMSPEQIAGGEITPQTDVYQLAVVAYELLTGALPFRATEPAALLVAHLHEQPAPIHEHVDDLPDAVTTTFNRALHKLPEERPPTATAFVDALDTALAGKKSILLSDSTRRRSSSERFQDTTVPRRDHRWRFGLTPLRVGIAFAVVAVAVIGLAALQSLILDADSGSDDEAGSTTTAAESSEASTRSTGSARSVTSVEPTDAADEGSTQDITTVLQNPDPLPIQGEVVASYDIGELWPPTLDGVTERVDDGMPHMLLEDPDVSITRTTLGADFSDGSAYLEASLLSNPVFYAEQCLLARVNASATSGYVLCLTSVAETFAFYFDDEAMPGERVELLPPEVRIGTNLPSDWNALEIRAVDDHIWFLINDMLMGAAIHDGRRFGEVGVTAFREGDQPFDIGWGVLATLQLKPR